MGEFRNLYQYFRSSVVVNLHPIDCGGLPGCQLVLGDGRRLPFATRSVEWIFSNAVIEHVGSWESQLAFASEIRRVARCGYFVATPNKWFPLEPHTLCPFFQFLPQQWQKRVVPLTPGYLTAWEEIRLLSAFELRILFPEAEIRQIGFPAVGSSLVAMHSREKTS